MTSTKEEKQPGASELETVRVRAVDGRRVLHEVTNLPLEGEQEVPRTRAIERAIAAGDLEEVGGTTSERAPLEKERF